ncbi:MULTISPECIES: hypothetical protein [unclassified Microcoleus]|uniref:hypothetical protein n=1 Tax=unclassified Microcoleus TaxID=2642155 RepID=UPI002FD42572
MSELRCYTIVKNGQDARSTKNDFSCGTGILPVPKQVIENGAISQLELRCCTIVKNGQHARSTKSEFSCGTGILPVPKQVIENGAISQSEVRSQKSEGKKSEGRSPMEVGRRKGRRRKETTIPNTQCPVLPMPNAQFSQCPGTPNLPEKGYTTDSTVQLFLAKINQKKAALLSW